ncbi:hypothetical protein J4436_02400 [Candidatus Woesearchaeota archaeon]|nr:hypothetical protein [Candidatus Woesearchaeota archaeon]
MVVKKEEDRRTHDTELIQNINKLVVRVDKLINIFEEASKHIGDVEGSEAKINSLASKLEILLEQNKVIAKGLILLEKYVRGKTDIETKSLQPKSLNNYGGF